MKVLYKREPQRSLLLLSNNQALLIKKQSSVSNLDQFQIKFKSLDKIKHSLDQYRQLSKEYGGLLGLIKVGTHIFILVVEESVQVASPRPNEIIYEVRKVEFFCLNSAEFDHYDNIETHPCYKLHKLLSSGRFYYSKNIDLTSTLQQRDLRLDNYQQIYENYDPRYLWNGAMIEELLDFRKGMLASEKQAFDESEFVTLLVRGYIKTMNTTISSDSKCLITLISKISTDFRISDGDEEGGVLNVIESEFIFYNDSSLISYVQVVGNLPTLEFDTKKKHKSIDIHEVLVDRHLDSLITKYGNVVMLNFIKSKATDEELIRKLDILLNHKDIINFDISKNLLIKSPDVLSDTLRNRILEIGAFVYDSKKKIYVGNQLGVFKVNFVKFSNSLKYGNSIAEIINKQVLEKTISELGSFELSDLFQKHELIWDENYLRINDFFQKFLYSKDYKDIQLAIANPGKFRLIDPIHDYISKKLKAESDEFNYSKQISLFTGTFNVNGESPQEDFSAWLFPEGATSKEYDIVAIGLQEVIELTTNNLIVIDNSKIKFWEYQILHCLNERYSSYKKVSSVQLGGIALMVFIKRDQFKYVKNIEKTYKKTGFGGISSNKGAVAISFSYSLTNICLISSHLSAGLENEVQRKSDYKTILKKLMIGPNRSSKEYDAMIWMGDFNYRITDLGNEMVRKAIPLKSYEMLLEHDQLIKQMTKGDSFHFFQEMEIKFPPTYKFDKGTSTYDTGEKNRIPAWTDRILSRGSKITQLKYDYVPQIMFSDHRPIYAGFEVEVKVIDELKKNKLIESFLTNTDEIMKNYEDNVAGSEVESDEMTKLPPPSSDVGNKWWINKSNGKIKIENLTVPLHFNPSLEPNPF